MSNAKKATLLAQKIKKARRDVGLSQKQLGRALKLSDKAISSYEVGRATPPIETLKELAEVTRKPFSFFFDAPDSEEADLQYKLSQIEFELNQIRQLLQKKDQK